MMTNLQRSHMVYGLDPIRLLSACMGQVLGHHVCAVHGGRVLRLLNDVLAWGAHGLAGVRPCWPCPSRFGGAPAAHNAAVGGASCGPPMPIGHGEVSTHGWSSVVPEHWPQEHSLLTAAGRVV